MRIQPLLHERGLTEEVIAGDGKLPAHHHLGPEVDCASVASSIKATCELEASQLPAELMGRLAFQLDADIYDGSKAAKHRHRRNYIFYF